MSRAKAKLFTHGGSQAVRLPKAYRFAGREVTIRKEGNAVILEPVEVHATPKTRAEWDEFWARLHAPVDEPFPDPLPQTITPIKTW